MNTTNTPAPATTTAVETVKRDITVSVLSKINAFQQSGELKLPADYSAENALKSAYLILLETKNTNNQLALEHCTQESIANALLKMVVWGLSPLKKQCDFIMYGNKLECGIEYTGNIVLAKRYGNLKDIKANAVLEGDTFIFEVDATTGRRKIIKHEQTLENIGNKSVKGAYAIITFNDGTTDVEIMNIQQIQQAWGQGAMKGNSPAHKNFPDQMACKTVINRACKLLVRGSDDAVLYASEDSEAIDTTESDVKHTVKTEANKIPLTFTDAVVIESNVNPPAKEEKTKATPAPEKVVEVANEIEQPNF